MTKPSRPTRENIPVDPELTALDGGILETATDKALAAANLKANRKGSLLSSTAAMLLAMADAPFGAIPAFVAKIGLAVTIGLSADDAKAVLAELASAELIDRTNPDLDGETVTLTKRGRALAASVGDIARRRNLARAAAASLAGRQN